MPASFPYGANLPDRARKTEGETNQRAERGADQSLIGDSFERRPLWWRRLELLLHLPVEVIVVLRIVRRRLRIGTCKARRRENHGRKDYAANGRKDGVVLHRRNLWR
jgi:hypothetical protein